MAVENPLMFFSDKQRHLVCWPYSVENLHRMATELAIKRCWFHAGRHPHYDIPKKRISEIQAKTTVVDPREILCIVRGEEPWALQMKKLVASLPCTS
jgi:hypothetical protein